MDTFNSDPTDRTNMIVYGGRVGVVVSNATFNNISAI